MLSNNSSDFELIVRQQPKRARVAGGKEKEGLSPERKPVDPPPIVQLKIREESSYLAQHYLQSPYYFMCCSLYDATEDRPAPVQPSTALAGTLVSSLHRLKDIDNADGGFFVFGDLSIKLEGDFRLKFTLFEMRRDNVVALKSILSDRFSVLPPKSFPGMLESTLLSRSFADQGVKLRIRKEGRSMMKRTPAARTDDFSQPVPRSPDRTTIAQIPTNPAFGGYPAANREYTTYYATPTIKRQRTSVDLGTRTMYDSDARFAQAYPSAAGMYTGQNPGYQNPMMPGYTTGQTGLAEYAVRQPHLVFNGLSVNLMMSTRSADGRYMVPQRCHTHKTTQMPYALPSSAQLPQLPDSQRNPQGSLQPIVSGHALSQPTPATDSAASMMPQVYPQRQYQTSSTILPPLQRPRNFPTSNTAATRSYFDQSSQGAGSILPTHIPSTEGDRYSSATGAPPSFDHPGTSSGTPR
ncbi:hypothetical protein Egran_00283 [Elaphomyces granulatus]|uniref:Velvet domain-containing protein n=1 Tax=Elaphomyces granulatus TaxID=519963 RepID=A0A232M6E5_9EURO|nr:hypothetical protein Egran_00283 [Elaphomyces granulatus]